MHADPIADTAGILPGANYQALARRPDLTISEFLQLGLFRVAYLTQVPDEDGAVNVVLHGADGMAVAAVETMELAVELADHLGLALMEVH